MGHGSAIDARSKWKTCNHAEISKEDEKGHCTHTKDGAFSNCSDVEVTKISGTDFDSKVVKKVDFDTDVKSWNHTRENHPDTCVPGVATIIPAKGVSNRG